MLALLRRLLGRLADLANREPRWASAWDDCDLLDDLLHWPDVDDSELGYE